jgi:hypothetical protein
MYLKPIKKMNAEIRKNELFEETKVPTADDVPDELSSKLTSETMVLS